MTDLGLLDAHERDAQSPIALIEAHALEKRYGDFVAVEGIDFEVVAGEAFGFLGPNGAGKSSTMRMIAAVSAASGGSLRMFGLDPATHGADVRAHLGVVPQDDTLDQDLTVRENLVIYGRYFGLKRREINERVADLLDFAQLVEKADERVGRLSGGMRRRLTIARALINEPDVILLDEPTTGLDPQARHLLWERLHRLKREGVTLVITTHYMDEAEQLCDRLVIMDKGRIVARGTPRDLIAQHSTREVVEVRHDDDHDLRSSIDVVITDASRVELLPGRALVYADDGDATSARLAELGVPVNRLYVRRSTLEDVFLHLAGRTLVD
jgi:lipooligosaccharide transport system ATP-binding protein